jgi:hypothetical protein
MSKGSKRPGWRTVEARYKRITSEIKAAADAARSTLSPETKSSVVERLLAVEAQIDRMEQTIPHDELPAEYDALIARRDAGRALHDPQDDRLFAGVYSTGIVYADKAREVHGDYKRVAFLPYSSLVLEIADPNSPLIERVKSDAAALQARRGQVFAISTCGQTDAAAGYATGQTVILGAKC